MRSAARPVSRRFLAVARPRRYLTTAAAEESGGSFPRAALAVAAVGFTGASCVHDGQSAQRPVFGDDKQGDVGLVNKSWLSKASSEARAGIFRGFRGDWSRRNRKMFSFETRRSAGARALVSDQQVRQIGKLINDLVDLDCWDEHQEEELFEHAVAQCIEKVWVHLPPPLYDLIHSSDGCLDSETAAAMSKTLSRFCVEECTFPFLDEQDSRRIIRCVVQVLIDSMAPGQTLGRTLDVLSNDEEARSAVVLEVFIKGAMDVFFDEELRKHLVEDLVASFPEVPLVPTRLWVKIAEKMIGVFGSLLALCLKEAYLEYTAALLSWEQLPLLPPPLEGNQKEQAKVLEQYPSRPFMVQLRRCIVTRLLEEELLQWSILGSGAMKARMLGNMVDIMFRCLPGLEKIEHTVQPFHKELLGESE